MNPLNRYPYRQVTAQEDQPQPRSPAHATLHAVFGRAALFVDGDWKLILILGVTGIAAIVIVCVIRVVYG